MRPDVRDYDAALKAVSAGDEEVIHAEVVYAILDGENPIRVWREYRKLTQRELAQVAEISPPYLSQLESGKRAGSTGALSAIAKALDLSLEDILPDDSV